MPQPRDPLSVMWDRATQGFLQRVYAGRGQWVGTRVADPSPGQRAAIAARGIDPFGPDNPSAARARLNARDRWRRAFVRSLYYQARRNVEVEVGRKLPPRGVIPAGRPVRARVRTAANQRGATPGAGWGQRWSDPRRRDW